MTEVASDSLPPSSFVPVHFFSSSSVPNDERCDKSERNRGNGSSIADSSANKKVSAINSDSNRPVSPTKSSSKAFSPKSFQRDNYASMYRYCNKDKPPFIVQVQESDSTTCTHYTSAKYSLRPTLAAS